MHTRYALRVTVIAVGNRNGDPSSNPVPSVLFHTNAFGKGTRSFSLLLWVNRRAY